MQMPKFVIVDGTNLIHRAYYGYPLLANSKKVFTNAVYGSIAMLLQILEGTKPDYVAVAFDTGRDTFRKEIDAHYKAQRKETPPELAGQFSLLRDVLEAAGIMALDQQGYEADDIIGTLTTKAVALGAEVAIASKDGDFQQLIGPKVKVLSPTKGYTNPQIIDEQKFSEVWRINSERVISPRHIVDLKALMGDSSDNFSGVPGIGEKTALKLITQFGTIEELYQTLDEELDGNNTISKSVRKKLLDFRQAAFQSKQLATIVCDMPFSVTLEDYKICPDIKRLEKLFMELELRSIIGKTKTLLEQYVYQSTQPRDTEKEKQLKCVEQEQILLF